MNPELIISMGLVGVMLSMLGMGGGGIACRVRGRYPGVRMEHLQCAFEVPLGCLWIPSTKEHPPGNRGEHPPGNKGGNTPPRAGL